MLYDTHCHPNLAKQKNKEQIIETFRKENPKGFLNVIGTNLKTSQTVIDISKKYDFIFCSIWIHPTDTIEYRDNISQTIETLEKYYIDNKDEIVAIWECWLDYYWIETLIKQYGLTQEKIKRIQKDFFIAQIKLAKKYNLPIIIHNRESREDIFDILKETWYKNFIFHCYSEDLKYAKKLIDFAPDCKISFSGIVTFKNGKNIAETAKNIPLKNILIETDSPYLTPDPLRGKEENEPSFTKYIQDKIITLRQENPEDIKKQIFENSLEIFWIHTK